jgi:uncharacterized protein (TIGR02594 family)
MYKVILAATVAVGALLASSIVEAKPTSTEQPVVQQTVKKKVVKKRKKKHVQAVKVAPEHNPFIKNDSMFASYTSSNEQSSSEYWAQERAREQLLAKRDEPPIRNKVVMTREQTRKEIVMKCSWFTCEPVFKEVVVEAKKWQGKNQKKDRHELKNLLSHGNNEPVDPARIPWCAAFANAILNRAGFETTKSLRARSFLTWGVKTKDPKEGDIVVLARGNDGWSGHVGFFEGFEIIDGVKYVKVLGGNTEKSVEVGYYPVSKVLGYRTYA